MPSPTCFPMWGRHVTVTGGEHLPAPAVVVLLLTKSSTRRRMPRPLRAWRPVVKPMVPRRADTTAVIGSALLASARGTGYRRTAGSSHMAAAARRQRVIPTPADGMLQRRRGLAVEKRQAPVVQHFDGAIDVAIMIGELQQHPVHLEPRTVVAMLFVGCRDVRGVLRHGPLVERRNEVREREAGPAWGLDPEPDQPARQRDPVGMALAAGARIQPCRALPGRADNPRRVVGVLEDLPQPGDRTQQRRASQIRLAGIEPTRQHVQHRPAAPATGKDRR